MTSNELRRHFENMFGLGPWPKSFVVTADTYGHVCNEIFTSQFGKDEMIFSLGQNGGIMFKGIELLVGNFDNPLQHELLDLISLMPDSQTQEIVDYITELKRIRKKRDDNSKTH
jgi:hypothetical protein